jgi:hypothetical protein
VAKTEETLRYEETCARLDAIERKQVTDDLLLGHVIPLKERCAALEGRVKALEAEGIGAYLVRKLFGRRVKEDSDAG